MALILLHFLIYSKLSACIEAIQSVLYPFSWPHAFIPVLPKTRWEIVEAPAPLICGVLSATVVNDYKIENVPIPNSQFIFIKFTSVCRVSLLI